MLVEEAQVAAHLLAEEAPAVARAAHVHSLGARVEDDPPARRRKR